MKIIKPLHLFGLILLSACTSQIPNTQNSTPPLNSKNLPNNAQKANSEQTTASQMTSPSLEISKTGSKALPMNKNLPTSWDLSGALAARSSTKSWTASINWLQNGPGAYQIRLNGPLGSGSMLIQKQGGMITLRDGAKTNSSNNAEQLLNQQTGIRLPVNNLYYWVRGIPAPGGVQQASRDGANRLSVLRQGGYIVTYLGYQTVGNMTLPTQIKLQGNNVFIKLNISRWKI